MRENFPVNSYLSQAPSVVHFGLGEAKRVDLLTIKWPLGSTQEFADLPADQHLVITEGRDELELAERGRVMVQ